LYKRAAAAGSGEAAAEIGKTYDPLFLANIGAVGIQADPVIAKIWYLLAARLGDTRAASLLREPGAANR